MIQQTNSKELLVGDLSVICRELTVLQVRKWLEDASQPAGMDTVSAVLFKDCSIDDIVRMTDLSEAAIDQLRPSQVEAIIATCKELNPHFFGLLERLATALQAKA